MKKIVITLTASIALCNIQAQITDDSLRTMLCKAALENSKEVRIAELETRMVKNGKQEIYAVYAPTIESSGLYGITKAQINADAPTIDLPLTNQNLFEGSSNFSAGGRGGMLNIGVSQVLFSGLQAPFAIKALENKQAATAIMEEKEKSAVIKDVLLTIDNLVLVQAADSLLEESSKRLQTENKILEGAVKNGLASPYDRKRIEAAQAMLDAKKIENEGRKVLLTQKLSVLTGLTNESIYELTSGIKLTNIGNDVPSGSYRQRPELRALEYAKKAADWNYKREAVHFLPKIKAVAGYTFADARNMYLNTPYQLPLSGQPVNLRLNSLTIQPGLYAGVAFSWTLFDLKEQVFGARNAKMEREKIALKAEYANEMLQLAETKATIEIQSAKKQEEATRKQEEASEAAFRFAEASYHEGLISVGEYISAEFDLRQAKLDHASSIKSYRAAYYESLESKSRLIETFNK
jgi:outer membrane protein TolC